MGSAIGREGKSCTAYKEEGGSYGSQDLSMDMPLEEMCASQLRLTPSRCKLRPTEMTIETIVGRPMGGRERQLNTQTTKMVLWVVVAAGVRCELQRDRRTKNFCADPKAYGLMGRRGGVSPQSVAVREAWRAAIHEPWKAVSCVGTLWRRPPHLRQWSLLPPPWIRGASPATAQRPPYVA